MLGQTEEDGVATPGSRTLRLPLQGPEDPGEHAQPCPGPHPGSLRRSDTTPGQPRYRPSPDIAREPRGGVGPRSGPPLLLEREREGARERGAGGWTEGRREGAGGESVAVAARSEVGAETCPLAAGAPRRQSWGCSAPADR